MAKKNTALERLLGRLDQLDTASLSSLVQRLARERGFLESVLNTIQEGVLIIADSGTIEYANDSAARLLGISENKILGTILWRICPALRQSLAPILEGSAIRPEVVTRELEIDYPQRRSLRLHMVPFDPNTNSPQTDTAVQRFIVIFSDITQEKISTDERIESERVSSILLLAAGVAHELGNPLNSLTIHLQLIERKLKKLKPSKETDSLRESIDICRQEVTRLDGIIAHFLEAIRPQPPDFSDVNLANVIAEVVKIQGGELEQRGIRVDIEVPATVPSVRADVNQVKQALFNVFKNASEAMQPGGRLNIRFRSDDDSLFVLIADNGSGIRQQDIARLFQPHHTTKKSGHGLGLMIVQRILRDHGGQVGIDSREGFGTVVTLQFPLKDRRIRMLGE